MDLLAAITRTEIEAAIAVAWIFVALALALSAAGRRLPPGIGEGLFVGGLSGGLLLLNAVAFAYAADPGTLVAATLVSLAVVWLLVAIWVEREPRGHAAPAGAAGRRVIRLGFASGALAAAALLGLAALIGSSTAGEGLTPVRVLLLALLLAIAVTVRIWRPEPLGSYALAGGLLAVLWFTGIPLPVSESQRPALLLALGMLALLITLARVVADWHRGVRTWRAAPDRAVEGPRGHRATFAVVVVAAAGVGAVALQTPTASLAPVAVLTASVAALVAGHCLGSMAVGELGLALLAETLCLASLSWLPAVPAAGLIGPALAGAYFVWIARFWSQQLDGARAWTTTGRLIPAARRLALALAGVELLALGLLALRGEGHSGGWGLAPGVVLLLHWTLLVGDAARQNSSAAAAASWFSLLAAVFVVRGTLAEWGFPLAPAAALAIAAAAGAARARRAGSQTAWVHDGHVVGLLPVLALCDYTALGSWLRPATGWVAGGMFLVAFALRWRAWRTAPGSDPR